jgi:hypothetical protein
MAVARGLRLYVFFIAAGGFGGFAGSVVGAAFGKRGLFTGGYVGGVLAVVAAAWLTGRLAWIRPEERTGTAIGAAIGFLAAATIAVNTLSSPVGPVLSTLLIGAGALSGRAMSDRS